MRNEYEGGARERPHSGHQQVSFVSSGGMGGGGGGHLNDSYESRVQVVESDALGNVRKVEEKREQHSKRTTQTTTTTTSTSQPVLLSASTTPVHFAESSPHHLAYVQQPVPVYAIAAAPCMPYPVVSLPPPSPPPPPAITHYTTSSGHIAVEHYPNSGRFSWSNADTYMHIFLTFYFGHFAAMLFFDGIIRNFVNLYLFEHRGLSMLIYILHIILSIALLAFCIWFLTICWRWWRNKSLLPMYGLPYYDLNQRPLGLLSAFITTLFHLNNRQLPQLFDVSLKAQKNAKRPFTDVCSRRR